MRSLPAKQRTNRLRHALTRIAPFDLGRKRVWSLDVQDRIDFPDQCFRSKRGVEAPVCHLSPIAITVSCVTVLRHQQGRNVATALCDEPGDGALRTGEAVTKDDQVHTFSIEQFGKLPYLLRDADLVSSPLKDEPARPQQ